MFHCSSVIEVQEHGINIYYALDEDLVLLCTQQVGSKATSREAKLAVKNSQLFQEAVHYHGNHINPLNSSQFKMFWKALPAFHPTILWMEFQHDCWWGQLYWNHSKHYFVGYWDFYEFHYKEVEVSPSFNLPEKATTTKECLEASTWGKDTITLRSKNWESYQKAKMITRWT